jgi:hypothetical protein
MKLQFKALQQWKDQSVSINGQTDGEKQTQCGLGLIILFSILLKSAVLF